MFPMMSCSVCVCVTHFLPVFLIAKAPLLLQSFKFSVHADVRDQSQDMLGQTFGHQLICEARCQTHQLVTRDKIMFSKSTESIKLNPVYTFKCIPSKTNTCGTH